MKTSIKFIIILLLASACTNSSQLKVEKLKCENKINPIGIDVTKPRLSWIPESNQRGAKQTAYQIMVASNMEKLEANTVLMAKEADLDAVKTLLIVPGFSSKGLGAAGVSQQEEYERVEAVIKYAKDLKIPIVLMHIGGNARRKGQSDAFNTLVADNAQAMIVVKQADEDGFFTALAEKNNIPFSYSNLHIEKLCANDEIDAVFVATPNSTHIKDVIACLNGGKHVIVEKPMAMNSDQCEKMIAASQETGKKLMVAHCMRFCSAIEYIKNLIVGGKMGDLVTISGDFMSTGKTSTRPWKYDKSLAGGGAAFDLGVHMIDTVRFLANSKIKKTYLLQRPDPLPEGVVDDVSTFVMDFENGVIGKATSSFLGPRHSTIEVYGTIGYARTIDFNRTSGTQTIEQDLGDGIEYITIENENFYTKEIDAFSQAILNDTLVPIPGEEGLINQKLIDMVNNG